jgi:hypothetical protein
VAPKPKTQRKASKKTKLKVKNKENFEENSKTDLKQTRPSRNRPGSRARKRMRAEQNQKT